MNVFHLTREYKYYALYERGITPKYVKNVFNTLGKLCDFAKTENLTKLTTPVIKAYLQDARASNGWKPKTFHVAWQRLKSFFNWCVASRYLEKNPVEPIEKPKLGKRMPRFLTHDQAKTILYHAAWFDWRYEIERSRNEAIIATFLYTGIRHTELLNLRVMDLDTSSFMMLIRAGKGDKDRSVPMHPKLRPVLFKYLRERQRIGKNSEWLFNSARSEKQLTQKSVARLCKKISRAAKIKFTPHMLRHTFGRELAAADFGIPKLQRLMGHASMVTTHIYTSLTQSHIKDSFNQMKIY